MNRDIFVKNKSQQPYQNVKFDNFFNNKDNISNFSTDSSVVQRHINDYDSNLLREDAYKEINDEVLKLEYKISKIESEISLINEQISTARDMQEFNRIITLESDKKNLENILQDCLVKYKQVSISAKLSDGIGRKIKPSFSITSYIINFLKGTVIAKIPFFASICELKQSLSKLENINKNVNELMKMQIPYGEYDKYDQISKYIVHANSIQSEISKMLK